MVFNSYQFILLFLPITLIGYYLINKTKKYILGNIWLIIVSLVFYGIYNVNYIWVIVLSIVVNFLISNYLIKSFEESQNRGGTKRKVWCTLAIIFNVLLLFPFKYLTFCTTIINDLFKTDIVLQNILLPLGISFFTFQQIAYIVDSYRGEVKKYSFLDYSLFVLFFPKIISGPITYHNELLPQFADKSRKHLNFENLSRGFYIFSIGLAKKVILADNFAKIATYGFSPSGELSSLEAILTIIGYTLQIYFDFSGYTDMAIGVALMLNFDLPQNFDSPYKAYSITDFWKRWHITLTRFLTKYIYIPLGGNRKGKVRTYINILIVFLVSGLWHGAGYTFIVWGLLHGIAQIIDRLIKPVWNKIPKVFCIIVTFVFVSLTWVVFNAKSIPDAISVISSVFNGGMSINVNLDDIVRQPLFTSLLISVFGSSIGLCIFTLIGLIIVFAFKNSRVMFENFTPTVWKSIFTIVLFILSFMSFSGISSFVYVNF